MITIDGAHGEGGGQILRTAVFVSLLTTKPFRMRSIRGKRRVPGLKYQQVRLLEVVGQMSGSIIIGAFEGSDEIVFYPQPVKANRYEAACEKPAAITLVLQSLLPTSALADGPIKIAATGGTDFSASMPFDYFSEVLVPNLNGVEISLLKRAFYPATDGRLLSSVQPARTSPINLTKSPTIRKIQVFIATSTTAGTGLVESLMLVIDSALRQLRCQIDYSVEFCHSDSSGTCITLVAHCEGGERLGAHNVMRSADNPQQVAYHTARSLLEEIESGCPVDRYAGDNLVSWLLLRGGAIRPSLLTPHTITSIWVCNQFVGNRMKNRNGIIYVDKPFT